MTPLQIAVEALTRIASFDEGAEVDSAFDSPATARTARTALKAIEDYRALPTEDIIRMAREGMLRRHRRAGNPALAVYLAVGREFEAHFTRSTK